MHDWLSLLTPLTGSDAPEMYALMQQMLSALPSKRWYFGSTQEELAAHACAGRALGIRVEGRLIALNILVPSADAHEGGYAARLGLDEPHSLNFEDVLVAPDFRRQGIHRAMLQNSIRLAREQGYTSIWATVDPDNLPSMAAFTQAGFLPVTRRPAYDGRPRVFLRLPITP